MLFGCDSFFSLPSVSRWNKNNNINEDDLFKSNNINNKKNNNKLNNKLKITLTIISAKCGNGTGKTSLITRFLYNVFHDEITNHWICIDKYQESVLIDDLKTNLIIYYIPTAEMYWNINKNCRDKSDCLIFIFDVMDKQSIEDIKGRILLVKNENNNLESILCANKCDLENEKKFSQKI